jgi:hypothetical protein
MYDTTTLLVLGALFISLGVMTLVRCTLYTLLNSSNRDEEVSEDVEED